MIVTRLGLAGCDALRRRFEAVDHGIAQHVLERRQHALEHLPVEFAGRAFHDQLGLLARFGRGLPQQPGETMHVPLERHHARAHQAVLHFGDDAALLLQQVLRVPVELGKQPLDAGDVTDGLGQGARELLDVRIPIEFERIEIGALRLVVRLVLVEDLRLGLHLELAQLFAQPGDRAVELGEVELDRGHLLLDARAEDAHFARVVQQVVEQVRIDTRQFAALRRRDGFAPRQHRRVRRRSDLVRGGQLRRGRHHEARGCDGRCDLRQPLPAARLGSSAGCRSRRRPSALPWAAQTSAATAGASAGGSTAASTTAVLRAPR